MPDRARTVSAWLNELEAIQRQMGDVSEQDALEAIEAGDRGETVAHAAIVPKQEETRNTATVLGKRFRPS